MRLSQKKIKGMSVYTIIICFLAFLVAVVQLLKERDDKKDEHDRELVVDGQTQSLIKEQKKAIRLQRQARQDSKRLIRKLEDVNSQLTEVNTFVTGGGNKPIISYSYKSGLPIQGASGEYSSLKFWLLNRGKTPINHPTVRFNDYMANIVSPEGNPIAGVFDDFVQVKSVRTITPGTMEDFYEVRIPSYFGTPYRYDFFIFWEMNWYIVRTEFTYYPKDKSIALTKINYLQSDRKPIEDTDKFLGTTVNNLNDYHNGFMLKSNLKPRL